MSLFQLRPVLCHENGESGWKESEVVSRGGVADYGSR